MRRPAALFAAAVLATGCAATAEPEAAATGPVETPSKSAPPAETQPPVAQRTGGTQTNADDLSEVEVTVIRYRQPFTPRYPDLIDRKGYEYAGIEAKLCVTRNDSDERITVSWQPWSLVYDSGVVVGTPGSWSPDGWEEPLYPAAGDHVVRVGRCVRGWIPFEVRARDGRPGLVAYTPLGSAPLEWRISG